MNAIPYDTPEEEWDSYEDGQDLGLPGRPRRRILTWWSAGLFAVLIGLVGLYIGIRVEKNQLANSSATTAFTAGTGAAGTGTGAARRAGATGSGASSSARGAGGGGSFRSLFGGGAAGAGGSASVGTVSSMSGNTLYVTETSGNTVKVTLSSATKVTKTVTVGKNAVRPGDLVVVSGAKGSSGTVSATTVSDTGASPLAAASGSSSSSSGNSASSAVGSLFGGG
jgi:hypothetical protein